jgi:hypothetical protein
MRTSWIGCCVLIGALAISGSAFAGSTDTVGLGPNDEVVPVVAPGDQIGIACDALQVAQQNSDVRVVLTVSAVPGDSMPSYQKVLATDQQLSKGSLQVKVPNTPDIGNHTYDLTIYVMDKKGSQTCDAGHVKVAQSATVAPSGKHS